MGKTKVFTRGHVRRELERLRTAAFRRAAITVQRRTRARIEARVEAFLAPQPPLLFGAREAIDGCAPETALEALDELSVIWSANSLPLALSAALRRARAELDELEAMLLALQRGLAAEGAALYELQAARAHMLTCGSSRDGFVTLKTALLAARGASNGLLAELRLAIAEAEALLERQVSK